MTIVHQDIHWGNAREDAQGITTLLDLDLMTAGPAEYDLGRPLGQWAIRFGIPPKYSQDFMTGYEATIEQKPDPELIKLGIGIAALYFSVNAITVAIHAQEGNQEASQWMLDENIRRIQHLDVPDFRWKSRYEYVGQEDAHPR